VDKRVLVADDDDATARLLAEFLGDELGASCVVAADGGAALRLARDLRPSLVLLDIALPGLDGFEVCRRLKTDPATWDVPVVAVSALAGDGHRDRALALGCADWVDKPFDLDDLLRRLRPYLVEGIAGGASPWSWGRRQTGARVVWQLRARVDARQARTTASALRLPGLIRQLTATGRQVAAIHARGARSRVFVHRP
jgi:CheY-like chemotaxis protein